MLSTQPNSTNWPNEMISICPTFSGDVRCSRVGKFHTLEANPSNWSIGEWISIGTVMSGLVVWMWHKPIRKLLNMWKAPDRIEKIDKKLDFILASVNLATALSQVTWQAIPRAIWQSDANGMTVHANNFMLKLLCRQIDEILGDGWVNSIHEDDREKVQREWANAVKNKRDFQLHYRWQNSTGEVIPIAAHASRLLDSEGNLLGFIGFVSLIDS